MTTLMPMRPERYGPYLEAAIVGYAQDNVSAGRWPEVGALERSREDFPEPLPQGLATLHNFLYEIRKLGYLPTNFNMHKRLG